MRVNYLNQPFSKAQAIINSAKGHIHHELLKWMEETDKYLLVVQWQTFEDHTEGFEKAGPTHSGKTCCIISTIRFRQ